MGDAFWFFLGALSWSIGVTGVCFTYLSIVRKPSDVVVTLIAFALFFLVMINLCILMYIYGVTRDVPKRPMGKYAKSAVVLIYVGAAAILPHCFRYFPSSVIALVALVAFTVHLHALSQVGGVASDINIWDVLLGAVMQVMVYTTAKNIYANSVALVVCGGVIMYKHWSYSTPTTTPFEVAEEELEKLPC